ncbi:GSCOCG00002519001-RA-CDS [Cotesia congregata]|uniref:Similar to asrij: OCIA domain-containing protein 1 (Drosophila melanogaster) n=1 Tax=Cotesia congregata TaxID=51543 RepID=A0A8J2MGN0_COTCN|nr:GSCOCG00002519001-RA-CDS [Cotesia congregata]CAG5081347.1 Similar to asrij: OCIA domain-containing protein 1 (Drosophila melanogaster) [Cotesia congregata]
MMDPDPYKNNPTQNYPAQTFPRPDSDEVLQRQIGDALNLQLTTEEMAVLKECQHDAVFHRGLPLAAVATGGFHYMMKTGMMKKNVYTLVVSGITGFFIGTASYRSVCMEKLIALPNSTLKERILAAQGVQPVKVDLQSDSQLQPWVDVQPNWETHNAPMGSALDIEPYQSHNESYSSTNNTPDPESSYILDPPFKSPLRDNYTSYDEMRRRNREEYERAQAQRTRSGRPQPPPPPPPSSTAFDPRFDRPYEPPPYDPPRRDDFL